jgi:hypothetical protein
MFVECLDKRSFEAGRGGQLFLLFAGLDTIAFLLSALATAFCWLAVGAFGGDWGVELAN